MQILTWLGAIAPILLLFILMSIFHMKTERAAAISAVLAVICALAVGRASVSGVIIDAEKGAFSSLNILFAIWPAIFLYEMLDFAGIFLKIRGILQSLTRDSLVLILLICWLFSSFLQGISGFGVPVAVCAPLLIALGVQPLWAVMITLLGHSWANTFGTFALAWHALLTQSETTALFQTTLLSGLMLWLLNIIGAVLICWFYGKGKAVRHMLPFLLVISLIHGGGQLAVGFLNGTIAAFLPTTAALAVAFLMMKLGFYTKEWHMDSPIMEPGAAAAQQSDLASGDAGWALFPFLLLAAVSVLVLLVQPIYRVLYRTVIALSFPETVTGLGFTVAATDSFGAIHLLTHAGFVLLATVVITYVLYLAKGILRPGMFGDILRATLKKIIPASLGIFFLLIMAQLLKGSGLMQIIAEGVISVTGRYYGAAVPLVGILGAFVTSSNTSSNILLGSFQKTASDLLSANEAAILSAQTTGGAIGTVVGPSTIMLGTTTAQCRGREGEVLRFMLPIAAAEAVITGIIAFCLV